MRRTLLLALTGALLVVPFASATPWRVVGTDGAKSLFEGAQATALVKHPVALKMQAISTPRISTSGSYIVKCAKGSKFYYARTTQVFLLTTPASRALPIPVARPDFCTVQATVQLPVKGHLTVNILAR